MNPTLIKWMTSVVFGLLVGRAAFGVVNPILIVLFGLNHPAGQPYVADDPAVLDRMLILSLIHI